MTEFIVLAGQFQPPCSGDAGAIGEALERAGRVIVAVGGHGLSRSILRPWNCGERIAMLRAMLADDVAGRVSFLAVADVPYRPLRWAAELEQRVTAEMERLGGGRVVALGLLDREYDSALPRDALAHWERSGSAPANGCDPVALRAALFAPDERGAETLCRCVPAPLLDTLQAFVDGEAFSDLRAEYAANEAFRARWSEAPWPPVFVTVDAVVVARGELLLIRRGRFPGRGLWALPGGFLDPDETIRDACIRELFEETAIACERDVLLEAIRGVEVFDQPRRSARGRTVTHVFHFELDGPAPPVRGGDDAAAARWVALDSLRSETLFEDHYAILQAMLGVE